MPIITTTNLKSHLGISDAVDDTVLGYAVNAANQDVVEYCGRTFDKTVTGSASARVYRPVSSQLAIVDDFWETSVLVVKTDTTDNGTYDTTWTVTTDFVVEPLNGLLHGQTWPYYRIQAVGTRTFPCTRRATVQVTAAWGWTAVPDAVFDATLIQAARYFKRKDSPEGVLGGFAEFGAVRVGSRLDPDVKHLLGPFRRPEVVAMVG